VFKKNVRPARLPIKTMKLSVSLFNLKTDYEDFKSMMTTAPMMTVTMVVLSCTNDFYRPKQKPRILETIYRGRRAVVFKIMSHIAVVEVYNLMTKKDGKV
jgi:hypothetical protein